MLPELDVFHAHCDQLVHPEGVALHHKDLVFVPPGGQQVQQQVQYPAATGCLVDSWVCEVSTKDGLIRVKKDRYTMCSDRRPSPGFGQSLPFPPVPDDDGVELINANRNQTLSVS